MGRITWFPRRRSVFTAGQRDKIAGYGCLGVVGIVAVLCSGVGRRDADDPPRSVESPPPRARAIAAPPARVEPTAEPVVAPIVEPTTPAMPEPVPTTEPLPATTAVAAPEVTSPDAALAKIRTAEQERQEKKAQSKLRVAKSFLRLKNVAGARAELEAIVAEFADTEAAAEARELLRTQAGK